MHACGNDFVISNLQDCSTKKENILKITDRKKGIGCDQLLLIKQFDSQNNLVEFVIYNADGSKAQTCINGTACLASYMMGIYKLDFIKLRSFVDILECKKAKDNKVIVKLLKYSFGYKDTQGTEQDALDLKIAGIKQKVAVVDIGNPHVIFFVDTQKQLENLCHFAKSVEESQIFKDGVNVTACFVANKELLYVSTWERGVGLTLSCGSAAFATYLAAHKNKYCNNEVKISAKGGDVLIFSESGALYIQNTPNFVFFGVYNNF
jgi:diaminopimelate epimerase